MRGGFLYLVAVMDWFSRFVLSWELSNTMETGFCLAALDAAFRFGQPEIWNSDSGLAVHLGRLPGAAQAACGILISMGWPRPRISGQCFHRTAMALAQVRADLSRRLRHWPRTVPGAGELLPLLQSPASASGARLPNAGRPVSAQTQKEEVVVIRMGDAVPQTPWDLSLSFSRMDVFFFTANGTCRTIEMLDRNIGQRAGMRPERRFKPGMDGGLTAAVLVSPPLHLRTAVFLSKQLGPPHSSEIPGSFASHSALKRLHKHAAIPIAIGSIIAWCLETTSERFSLNS